MLKRSAAAAFAAALLAAAPAAAQSLADVARAEEARRATAKKAVKTFSNADLRPEDISLPGSMAATSAAQPSVPATAAAGNASPEASANASPAKPAAAGAPMTEADWRQRAQSIRNQLLKAQAQADELAAGAIDEKRPASERALSQRRLDRQRKFIAGIEGDWLKLEQEAAAQKVPAEWLGARPTLSTRTPQ